VPEVSEKLGICYYDDVVDLADDNNYSVQYSVVRTEKFDKFLLR